MTPTDTNPDDLRTYQRSVISLGAVGMPVQSADIAHVTEHINVCTSRFGGPAAVTPQHPWPIGHNNRPMLHLAQLNLNELPSLAGNYPSSGLLQFFLADDAEAGVDFYDDEYVGCCIRLIPTEEFANAWAEWYLPQNAQLFDGGYFEITGELIEQNPRMDDRDFESLPPEARTFFRRAQAPEGGSYFGRGWATFLQGEPRQPDDPREQLFQIDSIENNNGVSLMLGDCGIGHFFIHPNDLAAHDFTHVTLYGESC